MDARTTFIEAYGSSQRVPGYHDSFERIVASYGILTIRQIGKKNVDAEINSLFNRWTNHMCIFAAGNICDTKINNQFKNACKDILNINQKRIVNKMNEIEQERTWDEFKYILKLFFGALCQDNILSYRVVNAWEYYNNMVMDTIYLANKVGTKHQDYYWSAAGMLKSARMLGLILDNEL
jgi:hypothetical protein